MAHCDYTIYGFNLSILSHLFDRRRVEYQKHLVIDHEIRMFFFFKTVSSSQPSQQWYCKIYHSSVRSAVIVSVVTGCENLQSTRAWAKICFTRQTQFPRLRSLNLGRSGTRRRNIFAGREITRKSVIFLSPYFALIFVGRWNANDISGINNGLRALNCHWILIHMHFPDVL